MNNIPASFLSGIRFGDKCCVISCYDPRIDDLTTAFAQKIRALGGVLDDKDIQRPPGGAYLTAGDAECRGAFYRTINACREIAKIMRFFYLLHTDCRFCHNDHQLREKMGDCFHEELQFHTSSAKKLVTGSTEYFSAIQETHRPSVTAGIILTNEQHIITINDAESLLREKLPVHRVADFSVTPCANSLPA